MKEMMEKIKKDIYSRKTIVLVIFIVFILGLLFGSLYITILDNDNKRIILDSVKNYFNSYEYTNFSSRLEIFKNSFTKNLSYFIIMWLLGLSIIGVPIIIIMIFVKSFITGFSIASIFACYKFKGLLGILIYILPSNVIILILSIFLAIYSVNLSIKLGINAITKKNLNFGTFMGKYFFLLLLIILICIILSLFDAFISPYLYNLFTNLIK